MKRGAPLLAAIAVAAPVYSCERKPEPNRPPESTGAIPAQEVVATDTTTVDLSAYFEAPDGDELTYAAVSLTRPPLTTVSVVGATLRIVGVKRGRTTISASAADPEGLGASQTFAATVLGKPGFLQVRLSYDEEDVGAVVVLVEGPSMDSVRAGEAGLEAYHAPDSGGVRAFVAGTVADGATVLRFWSEDVTAPGDYRGSLLEAAGKDYGQRPVESGTVAIEK